jgi:anti-sigma factor RsiW
MTAGQNDRIKFEVTDEALHAYVDGQLDAECRAAVEAYLKERPEKTVEIAHWRRQNAALTTMFGPVAAEPVPSRLDPHRLAANANRARWDWTRVAAAAVLIVGLSGGVGWYLRGAATYDESSADLLIDGAVTAHALYVAESRHAVEVGADDKSHLVTWLSSRLGRPIGAPDLSAQGFSLVGGRLLPPLAETGTGPAAQLMYQNASSSRLTVYITAASSHPGKASETETEKGLEAYYWANDQITCTVVGDATDPNMPTLAKGVYEQLSWRPDPPGRW